MSSENTMNVRNIEEYHDHFRKVAPECSRGPSENRTCNDKACCVLFLILTIVFVAIGLFYIKSTSVKQVFNNYMGNQDFTSSQGQETDYIHYLKSALPIIISMVGLAIILSVIFLVLLIKFPRCMFYTMLAVALILITALMVLMFYSGVIIAGIVLLLMLLGFGCFLFCVRGKIRAGVVLLNTASKFIGAKPTVLLAPFLVLFFVLLFEVFWIASMTGITLYEGNEGSNGGTISETQRQVNSYMSILWSFFHIFYSFFFYYCLVFIVSTACALWYYNIDKNYLFTSMKNIIRYHVGSFSFAALIVTLVTMLKETMQQQARGNSGACGVCFCLLGCCISILEDLLEVLNHNAIIVMSVTGESYLDSAKSAISLIFDNFALFFLVDVMSTILTLAGILLISGVPSVIGYFLLKETNSNPDQPYEGLGVAAIFLISLLIGSLFLSILSESLSCVFIFYCFDKKFHQMGYEVTNSVPPPMKQLFL